MSDTSQADIQFLSNLNDVIAKNMSNEQFGVTELADEMHMSRSNLLRKVKKSTNLPVNQLIREARLRRAMELLKGSSSNVSEVSHQVGFNSTSYFIKCFREFYGYPPGEAGKRSTAEPVVVHHDTKVRNWRKVLLIIGSAVAAGLVIGLVFYYYKQPVTGTVDRSIVVLPFKNESSDSTNIYLINGLMESTLSNLQKIEDLRVLSRTSSEKYRDTHKSIVEMASELDVNYFVEGSGQKIGDQILLNIQLIEGPTDKHLWAKQYRRKITDIFDLQQEVASNIAQEIKVIISPEAKERIEKVPTENLEAYDLYLKGKEKFYESSTESLAEAVILFEKAIALDDRFALAYAHLVMVEYYHDIFRLEKRYTEDIRKYADKAMLFDPKSGESLIAKALSYALDKEYKSAVLYLEKALEYNPNSGLVYHFLTEFYSLYVSDPAKYLEYSLRGAHEDRVVMDSVTLGFKFFHASNSMIQAGFVDDAIRYIDRSLDYHPKQFFAGYISILFRFAKSRDLEATKKLLITEFEKTNNRADIVKELAKIACMERDYATANRYYERFVDLRAQLHFDIYQEEDVSISFVFSKVGKKEEAAMYMKQFKAFADGDVSIYKHLHLSLYYACIGNATRALDELELFSKEDNYQFWMILIENDPMFDLIRDNPRYKVVMDMLKKKFWDKHEKLKDDLEEKGLYPFEEFVPLN